MKNSKYVSWKVVCPDCGTANILNPNCSEVVWRLEVKRSTREEILKSLEPMDEDEFIYTDDFDECVLSEMLKQLEGVADIESTEFILDENQAGDGVLEYVKECFEIVKRYKKGEITLMEAEGLEKIAVLKKNNGEYQDY